MDTINDIKLQKERTIKGPAGNLNVIEYEGVGTAVVFLHSFGGSIAHWKYQMKFIPNRTISFDLRGHGKSDAPADKDYRVETMVEDLEAVADSLHLGSFILAGHSMGGSVAIAYAGKHPEKVAGLLVTGTPGKSDEEQAKKIIASLESDQYDKVMKDYMNKLLMNATAETSEMEQSGMKKISKETSIAIIKSIFEYDPEPDLKNYDGPKMIIDLAEMEEQPQSLHQLFPAITYNTVSGTSHWIQLDKPYAFNKLLKEFLQEVENSSKEK